MSICDLIKNRKSCRAFLEKDVPLEIIHKLLDTAKWSPSGVNHQPTQIAILGKVTKKFLCEKLAAQFAAGTLPNPDYLFCPKDWSSTYTNRRKASGLAMYSALAINPNNLENKKKQKEKNYHFFHAPLGLIIYIEKNMPIGSWLDAGMFIQNILLASQELGLATCPQASLAEYPDTVRTVLGLSHVDIICGIALGYEDKEHPINSYRTERESIESFTTWFP